MIQVQQLWKHYGPKPVLNGISFAAEKNTIVGFIGKNGAGKSTAMNIMVGYLAPDAGSVLICGEDVARSQERAKRHIGYLPEIPPLYPELTVQEYLSYACDIKGVPRKERREHVEAVCRRTHISDMRKRLVRNLSKGYKQRVGLANALIGSPEVILLDEPTVGMDPQQMIEMRECIRELKKEHTVILSSHILSEVAVICDRILIVHHGNIVSDQPMAQMLRESAACRYDLLVSSAPEDLPQRLSACPGLQCAPRDEAGFFRLTLDAEKEKAALEDMFRLLYGMNSPILRLEKKENSLEEIFISLTAETEENA